MSKRKDSPKIFALKSLYEIALYSKNPSLDMIDSQSVSDHQFDTYFLNRTWDGSIQDVFTLSDIDVRQYILFISLMIADEMIEEDENNAFLNGPNKIILI